MKNQRKEAVELEDVILSPTPSVPSVNENENNDHVMLMQLK